MAFFDNLTAQNPLLMAGLSILGAQGRSSPLSSIGQGAAQGLVLSQQARNDQARLEMMRARNQTAREQMGLQRAQFDQKRQQMEEVQRNIQRIAMDPVFQQRTGLPPETTIAAMNAQVDINDLIPKTGPTAQLIADMRAEGFNEEEIRRRVMRPPSQVTISEAEKPLGSEVARSLAMVNRGRRNMGEAFSAIQQNPEMFRQVAAYHAVRNVPGAAAAFPEEVKLAHSALESGMTAAVRFESGAAVPQEEVVREARLAMGSMFDRPETALTRISRRIQDLDEAAGLLGKNRGLTSSEPILPGLLEGGMPTLEANLVAEESAGSTAAPPVAIFTPENNALIDRAAAGETLTAEEEARLDAILKQVEERR